MNLAVLPSGNSDVVTATALLADLASQLRAGEIIPYLGPGVSQFFALQVPMTPEDLAAFFATKVALPRRAKGNAWASTEHIDSMKHRSTLSALMSEAFGTPVKPA